MPRGTPLTKSIKRKKSTREQPRYNKMLNKAAGISAGASASVGRVSNAERRAIKKAAAAVRLVTTSGEAAGVKKQLRRKARRS